jgi:hypothetical protein
MRTYIVRAGDSPALIAARFAGCPKCAIDLVPANPNKPADVKPNGFVTFKALRPGEVLNLPDKWFTKEFDELPPAYFARLPSPDGTTAGVDGPPSGALGATFSAGLVSAAQTAYAAMAADASYCMSVARPGTAVNSAVHGFKTAWNATQSPPVPINTGNYETSVAAALAQVIGHAPAACDAPAQMLPGSATKAPLSTGSVVGIGLLVAGTVGGAAYFLHEPTRRRVHRVYRHAQRRFGR